MQRPDLESQFEEELERELPTRGAGVPADLARRRKKDRKAIMTALNRFLQGSRLEPPR